MSIKIQELFRNDLEIRTAFITVFDKKDVIQFAAALHAHGVTIISTGGTFKALRDVGIPVIPVTDIAPFPEMLDGRVKILQPQVFGGLLANKANKEHLDKIAEYNIKTIDMFVCNFYPFELVAAKEGVTGTELLDNIDIGGPSGVKSAAKNLGSVCVVPTPDDYPTVLAAMNSNNGKVPYSTRLELALKAFGVVARYEGAIAATLPLRLGKDASTMPKSKVV